MSMYAISNELTGSRQAITSTYKTITLVTATSGSLAPGEITDLLLGAFGPYASTDAELQWDISKQTAVGTATAATPVPTNPKFAACAATGAVNATAEGTITATSSVFNFAGNQRASYRFSTLKGTGLIWPPTAAAGFALRMRSTQYTTAGATGQLWFDE
jgi:hypothetical protein